MEDRTERVKPRRQSQSIVHLTRAVYPVTLDLPDHSSTPWTRDPPRGLEVNGAAFLAVILGLGVPLVFLITLFIQSDAQVPKF